MFPNLYIYLSYTTFVYLYVYNVIKKNIISHFFYKKYIIKKILTQLIKLFKICLQTF